MTLAGLPLDYLIGKDDPYLGNQGVVTEVGYDVDALSAGPTIAYCNLFDEKNTGQYGPYLPPNDTSQQYNEPIPDPAGPGFFSNLREQFTRRLDLGFQYVELDNMDAYDLPVVMMAVALAETFHLKVIAKNRDDIQLLRHPNVAGLIIEEDGGQPAIINTHRPSPDFPVWFVSFGDGKTWANSIASEIKATGYTNMGVTYSPQGEYESSTDILLPIGETMSSAWRVAKSLATLRDQINALYPNRDKSNDGTIGDEAHQATNSDHNPNEAGVVTAMDITNDPAHGLTSRKLAEQLIASRDHRIKYIISDNEIVSSYISPWKWRPYSGSNPHIEHVHISVLNEPELYDDTAPWQLGLPQAPTIAAPPNRQMGITATEFAGEDDSIDSRTGAYTGKLIDPNTPGFALPYRFPERPLPTIRAFHGGKSVIGPVVDVGPWNIADPYWLTNRRPQAESGTDTKGRRTNKAGIDLTPAAARAIGIDGKGLVDWEFATGGPPVIQPPVVEPPAPPVVHPPTQPVPPVATDAATQILIDLATKLAKDHEKEIAAGAISIIDKLIGGQTLVGQKTALALVAYGALTIAQALGYVGTGTPTATILTTVILVLGGLGLLAKLDRLTQAITTTTKG